jgi:hypothetical protein
MPNLGLKKTDKKVEGEYLKRERGPAWGGRRTREGNVEG